MQEKPNGIIITIDGPAGSGKTTTAKRVAEKLGYLHLDSGALYRAATLVVLRRNIDVTDQDAVARVVRATCFDLRNINGQLHVFVDEQDVTEEIRLPKVTRMVKYVASNPAVREILTEKQQSLAKNGRVVIEGRDTGTVVFPDAQLKVYMVATLEERARRRQKELREQNIHVELEELKREIAERDRADSEREHSPLKKPKDAIIIDTSKMNIEEQVELVVNEARKRGA